jgi:hypothetical protein
MYDNEHAFYFCVRLTVLIPGLDKSVHFLLRIALVYGGDGY